MRQIYYILFTDVVLTSKHHEGWCNFPSAQHWNWNSMDVGAHRDLLGNLSSSVRAQGLHMGYYHSLREWYNPLYEQVCVCLSVSVCVFVSKSVCVYVSVSLCTCVWSVLFWRCFQHMQYVVRITLMNAQQLLLWMMYCYQH